ncbi:MAG: hypothetical protein LBC75_05650 [Fibromonadaceae bacterium]|jgi:hypothetical protein|nr:hypothetical protein [Fibromonadaceae bacterium]
MQNEEELLNDKMFSLVKVWAGLLHSGLVDGTIFSFNHSIATKVVTHYLSDLKILKIRYGIKDRVQYTKIAGLMANAILKYRPIVPIKGNQVGIEESKCNELLAVCHGIFVCVENQQLNVKIMKELFTDVLFKDWANKFLHLLRERNYTAESLVMVFETLCLSAKRI